MPGRSTRRLLLNGLAQLGLVAIAGCTTVRNLADGVQDSDDVNEEGATPTEDGTAAVASRKDSAIEAYRKGVEADEKGDEQISQGESLINDEQYTAAAEEFEDVKQFFLQSKDHFQTAADIVAAIEGYNHAAALAREAAKYADFMALQANAVKEVAEAYAEYGEESEEAGAVEDKFRDTVVKADENYSMAPLEEFKTALESENVGTVEETDNTPPVASPDYTETPPELTENEQEFFEMYYTAYQSTEEAMSFVNQALGRTEDRQFDGAEASATTAELRIQDAIDVVENDRFNAIANSMDENTSLDMMKIINQFSRAIDSVDKAAELALKANSARSAGNEDRYHTLNSEATIALDEAEFLLPMDPSTLRRNYVG